MHLQTIAGGVRRRASKGACRLTDRLNRLALKCLILYDGFRFSRCMAVYRFENFELWAHTGELFRDGTKVPLQPQPLKLLCRLVGKPRELVSRQELAAELWRGTTFTDFEQGLNIAVKKLREALGDSAEQPRLIETLPRRGYRFIGSVAVDLGDVRVRRSGRRWRVAAFAGLVCVSLLLAAVAWKVAHSWKSGASNVRHTVLVAQFRNETGETELEGVLEDALEAELALSRRLDIASSERVADALKLMRRPVVARVPPGLARQVCLRDPGLSAAVTGFMRKLGTSYLLGAEIFQPESGRVEITFRETAADKNGILPAAGRLSVSIRKWLGEELPAQVLRGRSQEMVTTSSLQAFKLYADATALCKVGKWAAAEVLLRQGIAEDPDFPSAYILLAFAIWHQHRGAAAEFMAFAEQALALADTTSDREAHFIRGTYHFLNGHHKLAIPYYEALFSQYPTHSWAGDNLYLSYWLTGEFSRAAMLRPQLIEVRPNDPNNYLRVSGMSFCLPDPESGRSLAIADRFVELARQQGEAETENIAQLQRLSYRALTAWVAGDVERSKRELDQYKSLPDIGGAWRSVYIGCGYLALGLLQQARQLFARWPLPETRLRWEMWGALFTGDTAAAARIAEQQETIMAHPLNVIGLLYAGRTDAAARMFGRQSSSTMPTAPPAVAVAEGLVAYHQGRTDAAIEILEPVVGSLTLSAIAEHYLGAQVLAKALAERGQTERAIKVLENATAGPRACGGFPTATFWPFARHELMQLYLRQGRVKEAGAIRAELAGLLRLADSNHVLRAAIARH